jgi:hypothetical protein
MIMFVCVVSWCIVCLKNNSGQMRKMVPVCEVCWCIVCLKKSSGPQMRSCGCVYWLLCCGPYMSLNVLLAFI